MYSASKKISKLYSKTSQINQKHKKNCKHAYWTQEEDEQLLSLITDLGKKWTQIGNIIDGRTGKQVRDRYT